MPPLAPAPPSLAAAFLSPSRSRAFLGSTALGTYSSLAAALLSPTPTRAFLGSRISPGEESMRGLNEKGGASIRSITEESSSFGCPPTLPASILLSAALSLPPLRPLENEVGVKEYPRSFFMEVMGEGSGGGGCGCGGCVVGSGGGCGCGGSGGLE